MGSPLSSSNKSHIKLLLLLLMMMFFSARAVSLRRASSDSEALSADIITPIFSSSLNLGCTNDITTIKKHITTAVATLSKVNGVTESIIEDTVSVIVNAFLLDNVTTGNVSSRACLANFIPSTITNLEGCSAMLLPADSTKYSIIEFEKIPLNGTAKTASFCVAMAVDQEGLPTLTIQANAWTLSSLAPKVADQGVGYVLSNALNEGFDSVSLGVSLTPSFVQNATLYAGQTVAENYQISGNYYDYIDPLLLNGAQFNLPSFFEIIGSAATRVIKVNGDAATWVSQLATAASVQDVALDLFGDVSMLMSLQVDSVLLNLQNITLGLLPNLGPYQFDVANVYAATSDDTLDSGQTLPAGVYLYVDSDDEQLPNVISDIASQVLLNMAGILDNILIQGDSLFNTSQLVLNLEPNASLTSNIFAFYGNTQELGLYLQTSVQFTFWDSFSSVSIQCIWTNSSSDGDTPSLLNTSFSCHFIFGGLNTFFTGILPQGQKLWVINEGTEFWDQSGRLLGFGFGDPIFSSSLDLGCFEIIGSAATRVIKVNGDAATWVSQLATAASVQDVALDLFGDVSMLMSLQVDSVLLNLQNITLGLLPNLGPFQFDVSNVYAATSDDTLDSGQTLPAGVYLYVDSDDEQLPNVISDIAPQIFLSMDIILNPILILWDTDWNISQLVLNLNPNASLTSNIFAFFGNTQELNLYLQTSVQDTVWGVSYDTIVSIQCIWTNSSSDGDNPSLLNTSFSCHFIFDYINTFFTGILQQGQNLWVINEGTEFWDQSGRLIGLAESGPLAFTHQGFGQTAMDIRRKDITYNLTVADDSYAIPWAWDTLYYLCPLITWCWDIQHSGSQNRENYCDIQFETGPNMYSNSCGYNIWGASLDIQYPDAWCNSTMPEYGGFYCYYPTECSFPIYCRN